MRYHEVYLVNTSSSKVFTFTIKEITKEIKRGVVSEEPNGSHDTLSESSQTFTKTLNPGEEKDIGCSGSRDSIDYRPSGFIKKIVWIRERNYDIVGTYEGNNVHD